MLFLPLFRSPCVNCASLSPSSHLAQFVSDSSIIRLHICSLAAKNGASHQLKSSFCATIMIDFLSDCLCCCMHQNDFPLSRSEDSPWEIVSRTTACSSSLHHHQSIACKHHASVMLSVLHLHIEITLLLLLSRRMNINIKLEVGHVRFERRRHLDVELDWESERTNRLRVH